MKEERGSILMNGFYWVEEEHGSIIIAELINRTDGTEKWFFCGWEVPEDIKRVIAGPLEPPTETAITQGE